EAIEHLMRRHGEVIYSFCLRILDDRSLADDVLQQVFLSAYRDVDRFEPRAQLRTWLLSIAVHRCQDVLRRRYRDQLRYSSTDVEAAEIPDPRQSAEENVGAMQLHRALADCVAELPANTRYSVELRYGANMSYEEIAALVGESAGTIQARVARAL